ALFLVVVLDFGADLLVVLLQRGEVLPGLGELPFLHPFAHVPVHERALGVHEVELAVDPREHLRHRRVVADHAHRPPHLRQVPSRHRRRRLVVYPALEPCRTP
ncbi:Os03g0219350, partial [Oryza sativa Japonica Group]